MKTPITYYGGKQTMLKHILPLIPLHTMYTEAFCGGAAVLFAKHPVEMEIINDLDMNITNFYWMAQMYYPELKSEIDKTLHSRTFMPMLHTSYNIRYSFPRFSGHGPYGLYQKCLLLPCLMVVLVTILTEECHENFETLRMNLLNTYVSV